MCWECCWETLANMLWDKAQCNGGLHFWLVEILPWRCAAAAAVVVALWPCLATLAGSRVWGDLPLSVRLAYIPIYGEMSGIGRLWRLVGLKGTRRMLRPTDATNTTTPKRNTACGGPLPHFCCGIMVPDVSVLFGGGWHCDTKIESSFMEAHRARLELRARIPPSAVWMFRMVAARYGFSAPSIRDINAHLLFNL